MQTATQSTVTIGGRPYLIISDNYYLDSIKNGFEPEMVKLFRAVASNSKAILDIGANIGCTALLFAQMAQTVHAFEPSVGTFKFLQQNIQKSGCQNIILHNIGLGDVAGTFPLSVGGNRSGAFISNETRAHSNHQVETIKIERLDQVVQALNLTALDFIKIDVEGFEGHVLRGAVQTLFTYKPVVVLELNHWCLNAFQRTSIPDFFDFLRSVFPVLFAVDGDIYRNLHNPDDSYIVMYQHIIQMRFPNILAGFDENRLVEFKRQYRYQR